MLLGYLRGLETPSLKLEDMPSLYVVLELFENFLLVLQQKKPALKLRLRGASCFLRGPYWIRTSDFYHVEVTL